MAVLFLPIVVSTSHILLYHRYNNTFYHTQILRLSITIPSLYRPYTISIPSLYHLYTNSMVTSGCPQCTIGVPSGYPRCSFGATSPHPYCSFTLPSPYPYPLGMPRVCLLLGYCLPAVWLRHNKTVLMPLLSKNTALMARKQGDTESGKLGNKIYYTWHGRKPGDWH